MTAETGEEVPPPKPKKKPRKKRQARANEKIKGAIEGINPADEDQVKSLLEMNGLNKTDFLDRFAEVEMLEMFQVGRYKKLIGFTPFINLKQVEIMEQNITKLENLDTLVNLERAWFSNNKITKIENLENCISLSHLFLDMNQITKLENLEMLTNLEVLSLHTNQIKVVEGLDTLTNLKLLHLAANQITEVNGFDALGSMEELNLSHNLIGSFNQIRHLTRLKSLQVLYLNDPHFGDNPVCNLCNYHTYALYHLQHLEVLDSIRLSEEATQLAEATFLKKQMYYNMRIKMCKRNTTNVIRKANELCKKKITQINVKVKEVVRQTKAIERELDELKYGTNGDPNALLQSSSPTAVSPAGNSGNGGFESKDDDDDDFKKMENELMSEATLSKKHRRLEGALLNLEEHVKEIEDIFQDFQQRVAVVSEQLVSRMIIELETGGNIRYEDGQQTDSWHQSCIHFLSSHFDMAAFKERFQVSEIRVRRVTKVHNRFLRNRFEMKLEDMPQFDPCNDNRQKPDLQYLFYHATASQLCQMAEVGLNANQQSNPNDPETAGVVLSNSISHSDEDRVEEMSQNDPLFSTKTHITGGVLMICKAYLGSSHRIPTRSEAAPILKGRYSKYDTVIEELKPLRCSSSEVSNTTPSTQPRRCYIFDRDMVLPEYLVSYDFIKTSTLDVTESDAVDSDLAKVLGNFVGLQDPLVDFYSAWKNTNVRKDISKKVLGMPPIIPNRQQDYSEKGFSGALTPRSRSSLTYLNLHDSNLRKVDGLSDLVNLRCLLLNFNSIGKIEGLNELTNLERLEVSYNVLRKITGLTGLLQLKHLELTNNLLHSTRDISTLHTDVPGLTELNLTGNTQLVRTKGYRSTVLAGFSHLRLLDGVPVTAEHRAQAQLASNTLTDQLIMDHAYIDRDSTRPGPGKRTRPLSIYTRVRVSDMLSELKLASMPSWWEMVVEIELDHQRLGRIQNLKGVTQIRKASFCDNELIKIEGFEKNVRLEELCLEENKITKLENLGHLKRLIRLDIGKNQLTSIQNLDTLDKLTQLSLEDNHITSLKGLESLVSLMELYIGNNRITELRDVLNIKDLPKLLILDLAGNPLCKLLDYRLYVIYHLKKLKVLDGGGIDPVEQNQAKENYSGKLTEDLLTEILGHNYYKHIENLDLSTSRIRMVDVVNSERFANLRVLVLDNNQISDVTSLRPLSMLRVLRMNKNRISTIPAGEGGKGHLGLCFPHLEVLELGNNRIVSISALNLKGLNELRVLTLEGNDIQKVDGLVGVQNLQQLVLAKNKIKRIDKSAFAQCPELRGLQLEENGMRSIVNLGPLPKIRSLFLAYNRLPELSELEHLVGTCPLISEITMRNNPLARKHLYRATLIHRLPTLQVIDGREVGAEEREKAQTLFLGTHGHSGGVESQYQNVSNQIYYYSDIRPQQGGDKVPIKLQSFTLAGFGVDGQQGPPPASAIGGLNPMAPPVGSMGISAMGVGVNNPLGTMGNGGLGSIGLMGNSATQGGNYNYNSRQSYAGSQFGQAQERQRGTPSQSSNYTGTWNRKNSVGANASGTYKRQSSQSRGRGGSTSGTSRARYQYRL